MWLYEKKITELEEEFEHARATIRKVQEDLANATGDGEGVPETPDRTTLKLKIDAAVGLARLIKEQTAFYMKVGDLYDAYRLLDDLLTEYRRFDERLTNNILKIIDEKWDCGISFLLRKIQAKGNEEKNKA